MILGHRQRQSGRFGLEVTSQFGPGRTLSMAESQINQQLDYNRAAPEHLTGFSSDFLAYRRFLI